MVSTVQDKTEQSGKNERASGVLLLPSHLFFARSIELPAGISPDEIPSFVELSLEEISPFAINQLYYGYYLPEKASRLLVFAAYRKQLAVYEDDEWVAAELVLPDFAAALGISRKGPTLAFIQDEDELTAIYWADDESVPDRVISRRIEPVNGEFPMERFREELRRKIGTLPDNVTTLLLKNPEGKIKDRNLVFGLVQKGKNERAVAEIERSVSLPMDLRDKAFLNATRRVQRQNRWLWSGVLMVCAGFLALGIFEIALFAGNQIMNTREERIRALEPEVAKIMEEEELANRLAELSGERLLPFEMLVFLNQFRPPSIYYTRTVTNGLRSFEIEARTPRSQDVDRFQRELEASDALEAVEVQGLRLRAQDGLSSFTLAGTFREGTLTDLSSGLEEELPVEEPPLEEEFEGEMETGLPEAPRAGDSMDELPPPPGGGEQVDETEGTPRPELPVGDLPAGETGLEDESEREGEAGVILPDATLGDVPVGGMSEDEMLNGDESESETPLPDLPHGDVPVGEEEPSGEEAK